MELNEESLKQKFEELFNLYINFINKPTRTKNDCVNYTNTAFNCLNVMNKIISLAYTTESKELKQKKETVKRIASESLELKNSINIAKEQLEELIINNEDIKSVDQDTNDVESEKEVTKLTDEERKELDSSINKLKEIRDQVKEKFGEAKDNGLSEEEKQNRVDEYNELMEKYGDADVETIIHDELISWNAKPSWAGFKNLMKLNKAIELSKNTLNSESDAENYYYFIGQACNTTPLQIKKNIDNLAKKCDFSKPLFCDILKKIVDIGKIVSGELLIRELIAFYESDE